MIKKILYGLIGIVVVLVIVGFLLPGEIEVSRSITVNAPAEYAYEEIENLENWPKWSYWNTLDTAMEINYGDTRKGAGAAYSWNSETLDQGKITLTEVVPFSSITSDMDFMENGTAKGYYQFEPDGEATKVTMKFTADMGMNPVSRLFSNIFMKPEIDHAFEHGLAKIKELAEAKPVFSVKITQEDVEPITYIGLSHTMSPQDPKAIEAQMGKMYTELYGALGKSKIEPAGKAFSLYPSYSEESMEMICAVPVAENAKIPAKYKVQKTEGGKAVKAIHNGAYDNLEATHEQLNKYIEFKNLEIVGAPWEVYVVDPMAEKDPSKWITEIYYPVKEK
jgi:effector-binding domain-containing protein/uncharacterized membrane protein